jgi:cell wall-associated NlpC family hydrolase
VAPARVLTALRAVAFTTVAGVATLLFVLTPAFANPTPAPSDVEAQIDQQWNTLEPIIEQYNTVHSQLTANKAKSATLQNQLQPLQLQVDMALNKVSDIAVNVYMGGPASTLNAVLTTSSPTSLADQLTLLNMVARSQQEQISNVTVVRDKYAGDKKALDDLIAQQAKQDADLAAKKKQIEDRISQLQKLRQQAYGSSGAATGSLKPVACPVEYVGGAAGTAANKACSLIGKPYIWGAAGPSGYDCSGLTMVAWLAAGVRLDHSAATQMRETTRVSRSDLRPGDLIFFYSDIHHVGIYVGGGWFVHAPHTGDYVRMAQLSGYYANNIAGYGRPG